LRVLIRIISELWSTVNFANRFIRGFRKAPFPQSPLIVSVGNIQAGGTGKTPFTAWLSDSYIRRGFSVAIVSRGVGRDDAGLVRVASPHQKIEVSRFGDEAVLQRMLSNEIWIGVGSDRLKVIDALFDNGFSKDKSVILLDDAFQNCSLPPHVRVVLLSDYHRDQVVYRDFDSQARLADMRILTRSNSNHRWSTDQWDAQISWILKFSQEITHNKFIAVTGIADPLNFKSKLLELGIHLVSFYSFPDHHRYSLSEVENLEAKAKDAGLMILTTGKDWVKISEFPVNHSLWLYAEPELSWVSDSGSRGEAFCRKQLFLD